MFKVTQKIICLWASHKVPQREIHRSSKKPFIARIQTEKTFPQLLIFHWNGPKRYRIVFKLR